MDIEEFYDANPARRSSEEFGYGRDWTDANGGRCELIWVEDTGELYAMLEPIEPITGDALGDTFLQELPADSLTVEVLAEVKTRAELDQLLDGWQRAMAEPGSVAWLRERLANPPPTGEVPDGTGE